MQSAAKTQRPLETVGHGWTQAVKAEQKPQPVEWRAEDSWMVAVRWEQRRARAEEEK